MLPLNKHGYEAPVVRKGVRQVVPAALVLRPVACGGDDQSSSDSTSPLAGFADPTVKPAEVVRIGGDCRRRHRAFEEQASQALSILVLEDQFADVLA